MLTVLLHTLVHLHSRYGNTGRKVGLVNRSKDVHGYTTQNYNTSVSQRDLCYIAADVANDRQTSSQGRILQPPFHFMDRIHIIMHIDLFEANF